MSDHAFLILGAAESYGMPHSILFPRRSLRHSFDRQPQLCRSRWKSVPFAWHTVLADSKYRLFRTIISVVRN